MIESYFTGNENFLEFCPGGLTVASSLGADNGGEVDDSSEEVEPVRRSTRQQKRPEARQLRYGILLLSGSTAIHFAVFVASEVVVPVCRLLPDDSCIWEF